MTSLPCITTPARTARPPDGTIITRDNLPNPNVRWTKARKRIVAVAVAGGVITAEEARLLYALSYEELAAWISALPRPKQSGSDPAEDNAHKSGK